MPHWFGAGARERGARRQAGGAARAAVRVIASTSSGQTRWGRSWPIPGTSTSSAPGIAAAVDRPPDGLDDAVVEPVDHAGRAGQPPQVGRPVALRDDRGELAAGPAAVAGLPGRRAAHRRAHVLVVVGGPVAGPDPAERGDHPLHRVRRRRPQELRDHPPGHRPGPVARPSHDRHERPRPRRVPDRRLLRDRRPQRGPDHVRAARVERPDQPGGVVGHVTERVHRPRAPGEEAPRADPGAAQVGGAADVAVVEPDDVEPAARPATAQKSSRHQSIDSPRPMISRTMGSAGEPNDWWQRRTPAGHGREPLVGHGGHRGRS